MTVKTVMTAMGQLMRKINKMTVAEAVSCCDNLINFMERKSFTTE
jgi:hypothetical protein